MGGVGSGGAGPGGTGPGGVGTGGEGLGGLGSGGAGEGGLGPGVASAVTIPRYRDHPCMYRWVDHTAELELEIRAATEHEVFADALAALAELLGAGGGDGEEGQRREIAVSAPDRPALLAAWMEELVFLAESEGFEPARMESLELGREASLELGREASLELGRERLEATVRGRLGDPPPLVKAVTYHRLAFERCDSGYCATVVLDV